MLIFNTYSICKKITNFTEKKSGVKFLSPSLPRSNIFLNKKITQLLEKLQKSYLICKWLSYLNSTINLTLWSNFWWPLYGWNLHTGVSLKSGCWAGGFAPTSQTHVFHLTPSRIDGFLVGGHQKFDYSVKIGVQSEYTISFLIKHVFKYFPAVLCFFIS